MNSDAFPTTLDDVADGRVTLNAQLLKNLRKTRGLSQEALAELCAQRHLPVSIASIKRAETGKAVLYRTARHLASVFDIDVDALATGELASAPSTVSAPPSEPPDTSPRYVVELHIAAGPVQAPALAAEVMDIVRGCGASLQQLGSAGLLAVFGLPQAFRSDAERAVRCALALRPLLQVLGARAITLRLAQWREDAGWSTPMAPHGDENAVALPVLVARPLLAQLSERFEFADDPDGGWLRLVGERLEAAQPALCGRTAETRQFSAVLDGVIETADDAAGAHVLYLRANAGMGKTRLAAEFAALAKARGLSCHRCQVPDAGADSWRAPLAELARSLLDATGSDEDALEAAIVSTVTSLELDPDTALFLRALSGARMGSGEMSIYAAMSHAVREQGLAQALERLVLRRAARGPLLLAIEDVHWGEAALFEALGALLAASSDAAVIWLLTSRIADDPLDAALRPHLFSLPLTVFDLAPLQARDGLALAEQYSDVDPAQRQRCVERAQGNPLFLTQLLANPDSQLPDSLKHLVQARLDALPDPQRRALRAAAVIGNRFELALLRELLGIVDLRLDDFSRNALVRRTGPDTMAFVHDLLMHCIYDLIAPGERQRLHRALAALQRERDPAVSAHHLYRAGDPGAFEMMLRAIRARLAAWEFEAALALAQECAAHDSTRYSSFSLALLKAHAIAGMGRTLDARAAYDQALMLAGRPHEKIDAVIGLAAMLNILEQLDEEERLLEETLPLARAAADGSNSAAEAALAKLLYLKGNLYFPRGDFAECRRNHEQAVHHARAGASVETEARALSGMGDSYYAQGQMNRSHELFEQCIAMCELHGLAGIEASNRAALGSTRLYLGQPQQALADALHSAGLAHQVGNRRAEVFARLTAAWVLVASGALDQADEQVQRGLALTRTIGAARFEVFLMESQARISWQRGDSALAERQIDEAAASVQRLQLQRFIGPWVLGTQALFTSDARLRQRALLRGAAFLTRECLAHNAFRFFVSAAEVSLLEGDLVAAEFYAERLEEYAGDDASAWTGHHAQLIRAWTRGAGRAALEALQRRGEEFGFGHAMPRLRAALAGL